MARRRGEGIPFARLARAELRKLTDTRASRWLLALMGVATPVVIAVMLLVAAPRDLTYSGPVDLTQSPQELLLPALGILAITSEWSQSPRRSPPRTLSTVRSAATRRHGVHECAGLSRCPEPAP